MTKIFYSQFAMYTHDLPNCEIQLDGKNTYLTKLHISERSNFNCRMKRSSIEPKEILTRWQVDGQICTDLKMIFVIKYLVDDQVLVHGMRHSEYQ